MCVVSQNSTSSVMVMSRLVKLGFSRQPLSITVVVWRTYQDSRRENAFTRRKNGEEFP